MDPTLPNQVTQTLAPYLPYLLGAGAYLGGNVIEGAAQKVGADAVEFAKRLWTKLRGRPGLEEVAHDVARDPSDSDALASFRHQLKKLLAEDEPLVRELEQLLAEGKRLGIVASGERSVAIGGNVTRSQIVTGDVHVKQNPLREREE